MSFNGSGLFQINTSGQPVVAGTVIDATVFNALTADLATGLSTCVTKDGQTTPTANLPMGGYKLTGLASGSSATDSARIDNCNVLNMCEFRLTPFTGIPVTTTGFASVETIYWTPFRGNRVALYDGSKWVMRTSAELSVDVPDATNMYDVFVYDNSGVPALELTAWTSTTTRSIALTTLDGVLVRADNSTRRYVGSFYCTTTGNGQTEDSLTNRFIWNYYNRVPRPMRVTEATNSWTYTSSTIRQANGSTNNQLNFCIGISEDPVSATVSGEGTSTTSSGGAFLNAIGLDSTTAAANGCLFNVPLIPSANVRVVLPASWTGYPGVGLHYLSWLEAGSGGGAFYGDGHTGQTGIVGYILG